jgi:hypothetical protein
MLFQTDSKDSKAKVAISKVEQAKIARDLATKRILDLLKQKRVDQSRLAKLKALIEDYKKGKLGDEGRKALLEIARSVIELGDHQAELAKASAELAAPAKAVATIGRPVTVALQKGAPNLGSMLGTLLVFIIVLQKFLAKPPKG